MRCLMAVGLMSCTAVVLSSTDPNSPARIAVYHAGSGDVSEETIHTILDELGNPPPDTLRGIYAIPGSYERGYRESMEELEAYSGIDPDNLVYMSNVGANFAANILGQVGV